MSDYTGLSTGAVRTVLSQKTFQELPIESRFALLETETEMFVADDCGDISLLLGSQKVFMNVLVENIEDAGILVMDVLSTTNASIDVAGRKLILNGESLHCVDINPKCVRFRCVVRRSVVTSSNSY